MSPRAEPSCPTSLSLLHHRSPRKPVKLCSKFCDCFFALFSQKHEEESGNASSSMTGPKRHDPNDIAANSEAIVTAASVASVLNPTGVGTTTTRVVFHDLRECELSSLSNNNNNNTQQQQRKAHEARPSLTKLCDETSVTLANVYQVCPWNAQEGGGGGGQSSSSTSHSYPRPYPLHPHQLAHQHTYPKISLTSITTPTCIKEEEEFGESSNGSDNAAAGGGNTGDRPADRRRLSAQYNTNQEMLAYNEAQDRRYRRSEPTFDEDSATLRSFGQGGQSGSNSASSSNINIPRTFSTSALRIRNRTLFWDKTGYACSRGGLRIVWVCD